MKEYRINVNDVYHNIEVVKQKVDTQKIYGVLKGNGYGLGLLFLAEALAKHDIHSFAVTDESDVVTLRRNGFRNEEILMLTCSRVPSVIQTLIDEKAVLSVGGIEDAVAVNDASERMNTISDVHLKIDTGFGRYGFLPDDMENIAKVFSMKNLRITGIYTHFHSAFGKKKTVLEQVSLFDSVLRNLREKHLDPGTVHAANSPCLFRFPDIKYQAVRIGSAFTGRVVCENSGLLPVGHYVSQICEIRNLPAGHNIGYGEGFKTKRPSKIAIIPLGHSDGFNVSGAEDTYSFKNTFYNMASSLKSFLKSKKLLIPVNHSMAPTVGFIGMSHIAVDVTGIECSCGDWITIPASPLYNKLNPVYIYENE